MKEINAKKNETTHKTQKKDTKRNAHNTHIIYGKHHHTYIIYMGIINGEIKLKKF